MLKTIKKYFFRYEFKKIKLNSYIVITNYSHQEIQGLVYKKCNDCIVLYTPNKITKELEYRLIKYEEINKLFY